MRKFILIILSLCSTAGIEGLPVGSPLESLPLREGVVSGENNPLFFKNIPLHLRFGFYGDYIFNRHMKVQGSEGKYIKTAQIITNAALINLNVGAYCDLFATLGTSHILIQNPIRAFNGGLPGNQNSLLTFETVTSFSWSCGIRTLLCHRGPFLISAEGQYFATSPKLNYARSEGGDPLYLNNKFSYKDIQLGLAASYRCLLKASSTIFLPYLGIKFSKAFLDIQGANRELIPNFEQTLNKSFFFRNLRSYKPFGYCVGLNIILANMLSFSLEKQFVDERAFSFNMQFQF